MEKVGKKINFHARIIAATFFAFMFAMLPAVASYSVSQIEAFRNKVVPLEKLISVNEFTVEQDDEGDLYVTWDRCVDNYLDVTKNFKMIRLVQVGGELDHVDIVAKSPVEEIDFNEGCVRLNWRLQTEDWRVLDELSPGKYQLLMQLIVNFRDGYTRAHLIESEPFDITKEVKID